MEQSQVRPIACGVAALTMMLCALPYAAGFLFAPHGTVFLGALNNLGDMGQYLAALRQGADGHLLYSNQYTSLRTGPVLLYPLYTATGLLLSPLHLSTQAAYAVLHAAAGAALLAALWCFCREALPARPLLGYVVAIFGGGLYLPVLLASAFLPLPFAPVALTAPEYSVFSTLLLSVHGTLGLAAQLWALRGYLRWRKGRRLREAIPLALGGLALGLCYPFGLPVLCSVVAVDWLIHLIPLTPFSSLCEEKGESEEFLRGLRPRTPALASEVLRSCALRTPAFRFGLVSWLLQHPGAALRTGPLANPAVQPTRPRATRPSSARPIIWTAFSGAHEISRLAGSAVVAAALAPAAAVALYYAALFHGDRLWGASNMLHLPPPDTAVMIAAYGPLLALAVPGVLSTMRHGSGRRARFPAEQASQRYSLDGSLVTAGSPAAPSSPLRWRAGAGALKSRQSHDQGGAEGKALRRNHLSSPFPWEGGQGVGESSTFERVGMRPAGRLLVVWAVVNGLLLLAPLPQSERLLSGWSVPLSILAAMTLSRMAARPARRTVLALSLSNISLALLYLATASGGHNAAYYAPADEMAAVDWLAAHTSDADVVMASAGSGNLIVSAARCHVVIGQNFETFNWAAVQHDVLRYYAAATPSQERYSILRRYGVSLVFDGPYERALASTPAVITVSTARIVFANGTVRVLAPEVQ